MRAREARSLWIHGPFFDLGVIAFGWVPLYAAFVAVRLWWGSAWDCEAITRAECPGDIQFLIAATVFITRVHRHYGLPLAYADRAVRARHRRLFLWAPVFLAAVVFPAALYRMMPDRSLATPLYIVFGVAASVSGVWNIFHVVMQKYGFLRIYSAKLGWGDARTEKQLFFSWMGVLVAFIALRDSDTYFDYLRGTGFGWAIRFQEAAVWAARILVVPLSAWAAWVTWRWLRVELRNLSRDSLPKLIFVGSMVLIYLTFVQSLLLGFLVFGFSHAFEYSIFATLYARRKYRAPGAGGGLLSWWASWPILANVLGMAAVAGLYRLLEPGRFLGIIAAYGLASSLLHFAYDGVLWKMNQPDTRGPVLSLGEPASCPSPD